jgi:polyisoprenyl-phosphate glycosyltransferase
MSNIDISIVSPVYMAESLVEELVSQLRTQLKAITLNYEILLIDDRSPDGSWSEIQKAHTQYPEVRGIRLSRNFGQHYAISAGLAHARGKLVIVMDCDLQDQPSEIYKLVLEQKKGYDIVLAQRTLRQDNIFKRFSSKLFYTFLSYLTGIQQDPTIANFGIYNRKVITAINSMPDTIRYFPTMVSWVGFKVSKITVAHAKRPQGKTSYSFKKLVNLALDICLANSDKPLRLAVKTGFLVSAAGIGYAAYVAVQALRGEIQVSGYASLLVSVWVLSGLIICIIGVVGLYVGKSYEGIKNRPTYIVDEIQQHEN